MGKQNKAAANFANRCRFCLAEYKTESKKKGVERRVGRGRSLWCPPNKHCPKESSEEWEHSGLHRACRTAVNSCLKACLAGLYTMYQSSQTEHSSFSLLFHMLVLTGAKQGHSAKADFFCPAWELAPLHRVQASFFTLR